MAKVVLAVADAAPLKKIKTINFVFFVSSDFFNTRVSRIVLLGLTQTRRATVFFCAGRVHISLCVSVSMSTNVNLLFCRIK